MQNHNKEERAVFIQGALKVKCDCFAYNKYERSCKALDALYCLSGKCSFYKTEAEMCARCKTAKGRAISCAKCKTIRYAP